MAWIVGFISQKGGVGKSTKARALAREASACGIKTKLADLDLEQATSAEWHRRRLSAGLSPVASVEVFSTAKQAIESAGDFDLLILDLMLPGVDGFEICKKIREVKNTPIIMVSAKKDDIDKIRGLGLGADDYITKPFSPSEMVARVKAHLARYERLIGSGMPENEIIEIRGLKIDKTARRVYINGEEKNFTTKEFDLLTFLAQNPNHVFTKEELFREIWDMESLGDIATVTVHIKKIREKIEFNTAKPQYIETIWGVGYRFKV